MHPAHPAPGSRVLRFLVLASLGACSATEPSDPRGDLGIWEGPAGRGGAAPVGGSSTRDVIEPIGAISPIPPNGASPVQPGAPTPRPVQSGLIDETGPNNPAGVSTDGVKALTEGGPLGSMRWLYPYEGTVFPRGSIAPVVMWEGELPDAVYLVLRSRDFEYRGVLKPGWGKGLHVPLGLSSLSASLQGQKAQPQLQIPQVAWDTACAKTLGRTDPVTMELTARVDGLVAGPIASHFVIAQATLKGSVYFNSYQSDSGGGLTNLAAGGKVLRIRPDGALEAVTANDQCHGCHSVSANGSRLVVQTSGTGPLGPNMGLSGQGVSFQLGPDGRPVSAPNPISARAGFAALYPDGSKYLATGLQMEIGTSSLWQNWGTSPDAQLFDATSGQPVANTGIPVTALMPMFSPDGGYLVFTDYAVREGRGLAMMRYDVHAHQASEYRTLVEEPANGAIRPGFPFLLPDNKAVVFTRTNSPDFTPGVFGGSGAVGFSQALMDPSLADSLPTSDLYIADVETGTVTLLAKAMGFDAPADVETGQTYLPFGTTDLHRNYFPTVSPVAAGGFFWVFFDSLRNFGNLGLQRQLWGTAIDISPDGTYTTDGSHPPFYVAGQEFGVGNHRAFAALDLCREDGRACTTGIDCCTGVCSAPGSSQGPGVCSPPTGACAKRDERCTTDADCCAPEGPQTPPDGCIAGFCAMIELW